MEPTLRSREYRRRIPYSVSSQDNLRLPTRQAKNTIEKNPLFNEGLKSAKELREDFPWLEDDEILDAMVRARLGFYGDKPDYDKSKGWIEKKRSIEQPYPEEFVLQNGVPTLTARGQELANEDMLASWRRSQEVENWQKFPYRGVDFVHGTREEAGENPWFRTMDEYSDALLNSIGSEYSRALQDALQEKMYKVLEEDLASENPQYLQALKNKLLPDFDYSKGRPTLEDLRKYQSEIGKKPFKYQEFERPHRVTTMGTSMVLPMWSATHFDPELNYNTSNLEAGARLGGDMAMNALAFYAPVKGAQVGGALASRTVPYFRNVAGRTGAMLGGALGGAGIYAAERGADEALEFMTGKGYHQYPMDVRDLGLQALLGGAAGLPWRKGVPKYNELRSKIDPNFTSTVERSDVADMIRAQKEARNLIEQGRGKVGKDAIETQYQDMAWRDYRNKFGEDEAVNFQHPPVIKDDEGIPLVQNAPAGKVTQVRDPHDKPVRRGTMENADLLVEHDPVRFTDASGKAIKVDVPVAHADADASLRKAYFEQNADYYNGMTPEAKEDLWKAVRASRERDSKFSGLFTGSDEVVPISTVRENMRLFGGRPLNEGERSLKNKGVEWLWRNKTTPGKMEGGEFIEAGETQKEALRKAKNTAHRRYGHNILGEKELYEEPKRSKGVDIAKGLGKAASLGNAVFHNVIPYSNLVGGVQPYTYEAYPGKENK